MIGKLIKHEWKSTYRTFLLLYLAILLITLLFFGSFQWGNDMLQNLSVLLISLAFVPTAMVYFITIFDGFTKSVYGDEGYLTHTLPAKGREILLSKSIMATFWGIVTLFVGLVSACGLTLSSLASQLSSMSDIMQDVKELIRIVGAGNIIMMIFMTISTCILLLFMVYFSISISKMSFVNRLNSLVSLIVFVFCAFLQGKLYAFISNQLGNAYKYDSIPIMDSADAISQVLNSFGTFHIVFSILFAGIYFSLTSYILEKKLHIR